MTRPSVNPYQVILRSAMNHLLYLLDPIPTLISDIQSPSPQPYWSTRLPHPVLGHPVIISPHLTINILIMPTLLGAPSIMITFLAHIVNITRLSIVTPLATPDFIKYLCSSLSLFRICTDHSLYKIYSCMSYLSNSNFVLLELIL